MTYKDNFVVEVKCKGKILRIRDEAVHLPFGSEYTLLLKNLDSRKASVKVHIDGQDVLDYSSLILDGNSSTELEGFLRGTVAENRFKFIQKTEKIQEHRGDKVDDGLIRVEFAFEKPKPETIKKTILHEHHHHYDYYYWWPIRWHDRGYLKQYSNDGSSGDGVAPQSSMTFSDGGDVKGMTVQNSARGMSGKVEACYNVQVDSLGVESLGQPLDDEGITVKGSECNQQFRYGIIGDLEESKVIVIKMKGFTDKGGVVEQPLMVKTKLTCPTCGTKSKSSYKHCPECGTYLS